MFALAYWLFHYLGWIETFDVNICLMLIVLDVGSAIVQGFIGAFLRDLLRKNRK